MNKHWSENIDQFIHLSNKYNVKMIMVGGGAVNFHGYQRHSADVDFWLETSTKNLEKLILVFKDMGYDLDKFPEKVRKQEQNISIKFSPIELNLELITKFSTTKTFDQVYSNCEKIEIKGEKVLKWRVLSYNDLIDSKLSARRPKDLLDIEQLEKIKNTK